MGLHTYNLEVKLSMMGKVKAHFRKTKGGDIVRIKQHQREFAKMPSSKLRRIASDPEQFGALDKEEQTALKRQIARLDADEALTGDVYKDIGYEGRAKQRKKMRQNTASETALEKLLKPDPKEEAERESKKLLKRRAQLVRELKYELDLQKIRRITAEMHDINQKLKKSA